MTTERWAIHVGMLGDGTAGTFDFRYAGTYNLTVSALVLPDSALTYPNQLYPTWGQVWTATLPAINAAAVSGGYAQPANGVANTLYGGFSYFKNLMPAIAYAVDHGAPGAAAAWVRLRNAAN